MHGNVCPRRIWNRQKVVGVHLGLGRDLVLYTTEIGSHDVFHATGQSRPPIITRNQFQGFVYARVAGQVGGIGPGENSSSMSPWNKNLSRWNFTKTGAA